MTEPTTEAGREHLRFLVLVEPLLEEKALADILVIEQQAREQGARSRDHEVIAARGKYENERWLREKEQQAREKGMAEGIDMAQQRAWEDTPHIQAKARADLAAAIIARLATVGDPQSPYIAYAAVLDAIREASDDRRRT